MVEGTFIPCYTAPRHFPISGGLCMTPRFIGSRFAPLWRVIAFCGLALTPLAALPAPATAATTITVNTTSDELNTDGDCSLREALQAANTDRPVSGCPAGSGPDAITIPTGTYTVNLANMPALRALNGVNINGAGAESTIIQGDTRFITPWSVIYDQLLACDNTNNAVHRFNAGTGAAAGTLVSSGSGGLSIPGGATIRDGTLYLSGFSSGVHRYNASTGAHLGVFVAPGSGGLLGPTDVVFGPGGSGSNDPDDNLYVTKYQIDGAVLRYNKTTGAFISTFINSGSGGAAITPNSIVWGPDKELYLTDTASDAVLRYDGKTGAFLGTFVSPFSGGLDIPRDLSFGPDRNLYVISENNDSILRYNGETGAFMGAFVTSGSGGLDKPSHMAWGPDGNLYVNSRNPSRVLRFNGTTGAFMDVMIAPGTGGIGGPGCLLFTAGSGFGPTVNLSGVTIQNGLNGGIYVGQKAYLGLYRSVVRDNTSFTGGGILNNGSMDIVDSTISGNDGGARGGGIGNVEGAHMEIRRSTISGNEATGGAGAVNSGTMRLINTTVSDNHANRGGGGIQNTGLLYISSSTIADNEANAYNNAGNADAVGGGVKHVGGSAYIWNSIIAGNTDNRTGLASAAPDCFGEFQTERYNIIGVGQNCTLEDPFADGAPFDQIGTVSTPINARLGSLAHNGGPTMTHALLAGSPAIDAARNAATGSGPFACPATDQRDIPRPQDGNGDGTARCDIGAYEIGSAGSGGSMRVYFPSIRVR
jgi:CSLREA domain-containing protein